MIEKRFKNWSPELDVDLSYLWNQYQEEQEYIEEVERPEKPLSNNYNIMEKIKYIWIVALVILFIVFVFTFDLKTQEQPIDLKTQEQIDNIRAITNEYKQQKEIRQIIKENQTKLNNSIKNVKTLEEKNIKLNREVLQLIK